MTTFRKLYADSLYSLKLWRVWRYLGLQDIKTRFRRSFLGPLWILLHMAFFVGGVGAVYGLMFGRPLREFIPSLTIGFVIWGFIVSSLTEAASAFIGAEGYIKQFTYPKQIYILRALLNYVLIMSISLSALIPVQLLMQRFFFKGWLMALPGFLLLLFAALGHITVFAYLGARFRDLQHAMGGMLQVLFFVTPIVYPIAVLKERGLDFVYRFNPLYYLIDVVRYPLVKGTWSLSENYLCAGIYVIIVWTVAVVVARRLDERVVYLL